MINILMKPFKEYLTESKKIYSFKIKVAGDLPENFIEDLKSRLDKNSCIKLEEIEKVAGVELPMEFPDMPEREVHVIEMICEYPLTPPEVVNEIQTLGLEQSCFRVRNSLEPSEVDQATLGEILNPDGLLNDPEYKETGPAKTKHRDYFGDDFNRDFLKGLAKQAKEKVKEGGCNQEYKLPKTKQDKAGISSPVGSK